MKKTYTTGRKENSDHLFRIGKALLRIEFKMGEYTTDNPLFQQAVENSELFKSGIVKLKL